MTHVKQRKLLKDGIDPDSGEPVRAEGMKWKNVDFDHVGKSYPNISVHASEKEANILSDEAAAIMSRYPDEAWDTLAGPLAWRDYSHTIQLPVRS